MHAQPSATLPQAGDYLALRLGDEEYAIDVGPVREIREGAGSGGMAVIDLRRRFHPSHGQGSATPVVAVLDAAGTSVGLLADAVSEIVTLKAAQILPLPDVAALVPPHGLRALAVAGERLLVILDVDQLLAEAVAGICSRAD